VSVALYLKSNAKSCHFLRASKFALASQPMPSTDSAIALQSFTTFGALLRFLRRRARLTQRDLGIAAGYSVAHINRFEKNKHLPDAATVASLFIPALDLAHEPTLAARLMELLSTTATSEPSRPEFIGEPIPPAPPREIARARILTLAQTRLRQERHLVLCGQPGVGKTTMASALAREFAKTMPVFWLTITEGMTTSAEAWIHRLAEFLLAHRQTQVKPLVPTIAETRPRFSFDQKIRLLSAALIKQPVLLCFDNAEVIRNEETCLQLLRHLCETTPAFLLFASRQSLPLARVAEITLDGFETDEAMMYIAASPDHPLDATQAVRLIAKVGGNPMLLRLAAGQLATQVTDAETFIARLETQPQVASYLLQTLQAQSSPPAWRLLLLLAVFQQPLNLYDEYLSELMTTQGGVKNLGDALEELQRRRLIGDATSAHLHPFIRESVYLTLNTQTTLRRKLHRLAGDWTIHTTQDAITAAQHYTRAGLPDRTLEQIEKNYLVIRAQGQVLVAVTILDEAQAQTKRMHSPQNDLLRRWLVMRGKLLVGTLRAAEGETNLREAVELASTPAVRASVVIELARIISQRRDNVEARRLAQTMRAELAPKDLLLRIRLLQIESHADRDIGNLDESDRKQMQVLALADQMASLSPMMSDDVRADAHYQLSVNARGRHHTAEAMKHAQVGLELARTARLSNTIRLFQNQFGWLFFGEGDLEMAFHYYKEASDGLAAIGDVHSNAYVLVNLANIQHIRGQDVQALEQIARATEILRVIGDMAGLANAEETRTDCLLWQGKIQEARLARERFIQEAEGKGPTRLWGYCLMKLAIIQLVQNETDAAIATLQRAMALPATLSNRMMLFALRDTLAVALMVAGDLSAVEQTLADALRFDGLERFAEIDRTLIDGYFALARGDETTAKKYADQVLQDAGQYSLYHQGANQLIAAIQRSAPVSEFPRLLWVKSE
jgi:ATP/maltotriose-dependent transcriptional regulator MalT